MMFAGWGCVAKLCVCGAVYRYCSIARGIVTLQGKVFIVNSIVTIICLYKIQLQDALAEEETLQVLL